MPVGLVVLSAIPVGAGLVRLARLAIGEAITVENARFFASPLPVIVHVISASLFYVLGAFQFVPALRLGGRRWHRIAGRLLVPFGVAAALSGLWMTLFYELPVGSDQNVTLFQRGIGLLQLVRLFVGTGMVVSLCLGVAAIRTHSLERHRAWMMRAYAVGMRAGTQAFISIALAAARRQTRRARELDVHAMGAHETVRRELVRGGQRIVMVRLGAAQAVLGVPASTLAGRIL